MPVVVNGHGSKVQVAIFLLNWDFFELNKSRFKDFMMPSMFLCILSPLCFCIVIVNLQHQGDVQHGHHHVSVNGRKQPNCSRDLQVESAFGSFHLDSSWKYFQAGRSRTHKQYWSRWKQVSAKKNFLFWSFSKQGRFHPDHGTGDKGRPKACRYICQAHGMAGSKISIGIFAEIFEETSSVFSPNHP